MLFVVKKVPVSGFWDGLFSPPKGGKEQQKKGSQTAEAEKPLKVKDALRESAGNHSQQASSHGGADKLSEIQGEAVQGDKEDGIFSAGEFACR